MSKPITIVAGDLDFQKTLTEREKEYIHGGCNWIGKLGRECKLKSLHKIGKTLDEVEALPIEEQNNIWDKAKYQEP